MNRLPVLLILSLPLCLEACASPGTYPSLARRDAERETRSAEPAAADNGAAKAPAPSADLQGRVQQLLDQARSGHAQFSAQREAAQRSIAAARGSARASENWVSAQVALGSLEAARSGAITALSEIDQLYADERIAVPNAVSPSAALLDSAREQVKAWVEEENGVIGQLEGQLEG